MAKHANISFFVPHLGCSNRCSFCNQNSITGKVSLPDKAEIDTAVEIAKKSPKYSAQDTEIAFFGGSFTAIDREYMMYLLSCANVYVKDGTVKGIRVSTRPDAINCRVLDILKQYGVTAIELGAQSTDENVLLLNKRGHSAEDIFKVSALIKSYGFSLGLQMMTGLYGATAEKDAKTVEDFIKIAPDTVRIYPTIVLKKTALALLVEKGEYQPPSLEESIENCCEYYKRFNDNGLSVIRLGLHHIDEEDFVAGPWHPAFSQLCMSKICFEKVKEKLSNNTGDYTVYVNPAEISTFVGQKRSNLTKFKDMGFNVRISGDENISNDDFRIEREVK